jgi:hypothetical protein
LPTPFSQGEVNQGNDRLRVLISRAPKRYRSITALNFFACPQNAQASPVPPMPMPVVTERPLPRFLQVFEPLNDCGATAISNMSTPSTSKSSLPVTPTSPHRELSDDCSHHQSQTYLTPVQQKAQGQTSMDNSRANPQQYHDFAERLPSDETKETDRLKPQEYTPTFQETSRTDRSFEWTMRREHESNNMLMMDGTFGRA